MKEIYDINIQRMNNGAHFTFVSNILARAEADTAVKGKASELVSNFKTAVNAEDEALKISQKSLLTDDIAKADIDRDALYAGYKKAVEAFLAMPIADMAQAAKVLAQHIKDYKINTAGQLDKETGLLVNFITDLEDKYSAQVAKLGLTAFVTNLKEANERVRMLTLQRTNENLGGEGFNVPTSKGSHSFIRGVQDKLKAVTSAHELLGHGLPSARKESPVHNNTNAIRTDNLVRRLLRLPQRDGSDHAGGKDIVSPYSLPYTK